MMNGFEQQYRQACRELILRDFQSLNPMQQEAVLATEGPLLILAGAGSGKTTVLINRIAKLLRYGKAGDTDFVPADADEQTAPISMPERMPTTVIWKAKRRRPWKDC